jgi:DNA-binding GntR family transcriptional regulator
VSAGIEHDGHAAPVDSTAHAYDQVRAAILDGRLPPGAAFSQVQLAAQLDVSRTPLREALRLLQTERLVDSDFNRRVRVSPLSLQDLEQLYAIRIPLESLGARLTVPLLSDEELDALGETLAEMDAADVGALRAPHRRFHAALVGRAGERLREEILDLWDHAERYRLLYASTDSERLALRELARSEHAAILAAARTRDPDRCAQLLAGHLARTALTVIAQVDGTYDPRILRTALRHVSASPRN